MADPISSNSIIAEQRPSLLTPLTGVDFERIQSYRAQLLHWGSGVTFNIADYLTRYMDYVEDREIPDPVLEAAGQDEIDAVDRLLDLATQIKNQASPIIDGMMSALDDILANQPPTIDITTLVGLIETALQKELDQNNPLSIYAMRELARSYVSALLLNTSFEVLASDTTDITSAVNAFITRRKSEIDEQLFSQERRSLNELANDSVLDSEIAATAITRANARKTRLYAEVDNEAEIMRQRLTNDAFERAFRRAETRIRGLALLPMELPAGIYGIVGDVINRQYLDPNAFISSLPSVLGYATDGFGTIAQLLQRGRHEAYQGQISEMNAYTNLLQFIAAALAQVADAIAKMTTMEAS